MSRILLADDSPHAQRMGERILREEGYEVVSVTDGETALLRLDDVDPDLIIADAFLPRKSGFEICRYVKSHARHRHVRVLLTAGLLENFDEAESKDAGSDGVIKKPFEASAVIEMIKPMIVDAQLARSLFADGSPAAAVVEVAPVVEVEPEPQPEPEVIAEEPVVEPAPEPPPPAVVEEPVIPAAVVIEPEDQLTIDPERVRAAVTLALDAALPALIDEITERVLVALGR